MTNKSQKPAAQLRLNNVKLTIWANTSDQGTYFSVQPSRTYKDDNGYHDVNSYSSDEILRLAHLLPQAVDKIAELRAETATENSEEAS
jgi:hypothetical protein